MSTRSPITRRDFLVQGAVAGAAAMAAPAFLRAASPNERLNLAFIGVGGRGGANLNTITSAGMDNVVALCDVNARNLGKASERFPQARTFTDFRRLFDEFRDMDAVVVSTTEHTHAFATLPAL